MGRKESLLCEQEGMHMGGGPVIYIKAEQSTYLNSPDVRIRDICSVYCQDRKLEQKVGKGGKSLSVRSGSDSGHIGGSSGRRGEKCG